MTEATATWQLVANSPLARLYVYELYMLSRYIQSTCDAVFRQAPTPAPGQSYIKVDHALHVDLANLLAAAARVRALVQQRPKGGRQSAGRYRFQQARVEWLRSLVGPVTMQEILHAGVRNSLEHFDEYFDDMAADLASGTTPLPVLASLDVVLGRAGDLDFLHESIGGQVQALLIRVYRASEREYVNFGRTVNVQTLRDEAADLSAHLAEATPVLRDEEGSGTLLVVKDRTFFADS